MTSKPKDGLYFHQTEKFCVIGHKGEKTFGGGAKQGTRSLPSAGNGTNSDELVKRVEALEKGAVFEATKEAVQAVQMECLTKLRDIRAAVAKEGEGASTVSSKELDALRAENEALKKTTAKQAYRIEHLVGHMEELLATKEKQ
mmetsp:Transcript_17701/g.30070  ORF Transcript_17701/g.30070 Transcript_17701/m.30070 type:complete len:143 (-) Transcript_17701:171-599(-)